MVEHIRHLVGYIGQSLESCAMTWGKNFWRYVLRKESLVVKIGTPILLFNPSPNRPFKEAADMVMDNIKELM